MPHKKIVGEKQTGVGEEGVRPCERSALKADERVLQEAGRMRKKRTAGKQTYPGENKSFSGLEGSSRLGRGDFQKKEGERWEGRKNEFRASPIHPGAVSKKKTWQKRKKKERGTAIGDRRKIPDVYHSRRNGGARVPNLRLEKMVTPS